MNNKNNNTSKRRCPVCGEEYNVKIRDRHEGYLVLDEVREDYTVHWHDDIKFIHRI